MEIIDSFSRAGKYFGCGNGMEYTGVLIIKTDLSLEECKAIYAKYEFKDVWEAVYVYHVDDRIDYLDVLGYNKQVSGSGYYLVDRTEYSPTVDRTFIQSVLNTDIRGH